MNTVHRIEHWGDRHHPGLLDILRFVLGLFLLLKGIFFMENSTYLQDYIESQDIVDFSAGMVSAIIFYVTFVHMVGGLLIMLGIYTRLASLIQIPVVLAAVFLTGFFVEPINTLVWPSVTALVLLIMFVVLGSGPVSLDKYLAQENDTE